MPGRGSHGFTAVASNVSYSFVLPISITVTRIRTGEREITGVLQGKEKKTTYPEVELVRNLMAHGDAREGK